MRLRLDEPTRLDDLISFFRTSGAIAFRCGVATVEVFLPASPDGTDDELEIDAYLSSWEAQRPDVRVHQVEVFQLPLTTRFPG